MLFLMRNLAVCSVSSLRPKLCGLFQEMLTRWKTGYARLPTEGSPECHELLVLAEGLHVTAQAARDGSPVALLLDGFQAIDASPVASNANCQNPQKRQRVSSAEAQDVAANKRGLRPKSSTEIQFDHDVLCKSVEKALLQYSHDDVIGFDPESGILPMTPKTHCGHCSRSDNSPHAPNCKGCHQLLKPKVDYGKLTDAIVWSYVLTDIGMKEYSSSLCDMARLLHFARCYQRIDEVGRDFFKLQCYFLTHLVYVFSDYGQHALPRHLFAEEFEFIVVNLRLVVSSLKDSEIVGEFLQCLKILGFTPESDPELVELVHMAVSFLIDAEKERGSKGEWVTKHEKGNIGGWGSTKDRCSTAHHLRPRPHLFI